MEEIYSILDTSTIVELIEGNPRVVEKIRNNSRSENFIVSAMSLVELFSHVGKMYSEKELIRVLSEYVIDLRPKDDYLVSYVMYPYWLANPNTIQMKNICMKEFADTLAVYSLNILRAVIAHLFYAMNYTNKEIWNYKQEELDNELLSIRIMVYDSYINDGGKFTDMFEDFVKEKMIEFLSLDPYYQNQKLDEIKKHRLNVFFKKLIKDKKKYFEYRNKIPSFPDEKVIKFEETFITNEADDLLFGGKGLQMNDLVDEQNFVFALQMGAKYYTCDKKSIKKYGEYFKDQQEVLDFINEKVEDFQ